MDCLVNGIVEPVLFQNSQDSGVLNRTCIIERHRLLHGNKFLPINDETGQCNLYKSLHDIARYRDITEVQSNFDMKYFLDNLEPFVLRYDSELTVKWSDEYFSRKKEDKMIYENEVDLKQVESKRGSYINGHIPKILLKDVIIPLPLSYSTLLKLYDKTTFWYSSNSHHQSKLHRDPGLFFIQQISGQKKISLVDPEYSLNLYSDFSDVYNLSPIDPKKIDISMYPEISNVVVKSTILNEGDICFLPYMYWHYIEGIPDNTGTKRNVALTHQFSAQQIYACKKFSENMAKKCIWYWRNNSNINVGEMVPNVTLFDISSSRSRYKYK
tara:strand:- start:2481 stop:3458 length:978 start_codon:yes stop_codon:yes gene_type:complete